MNFELGSTQHETRRENAQIFGAGRLGAWWGGWAVAANIM